MRTHLHGANLVTSVSLAAGFCALLVLPAHLLLAVALVLLAAVLDVVDGALARRSGGGTVFGGQLDSLADLLCFCVVPAYALATVVGSEEPVGAGVVAAGFLLAGAWRLARFPLVQQQGHFVGLPTPAGGGLLLLLVLWAPLVLALAGALLLSALMISTVRFPSVLAAAATVRHPGLRDRRPIRQVRRIHAARQRALPRRRPRRPRSQDPVGPAALGRRRRATDRAARLVRAARASARRH